MLKCQHEVGEFIDFSEQVFNVKHLKEEFPAKYRKSVIRLMQRHRKSVVIVMEKYHDFISNFVCTIAISIK